MLGAKLGHLTVRKRKIFFVRERTSNEWFKIQSKNEKHVIYRRFLNYSQNMSPTEQRLLSDYYNNRFSYGEEIFWFDRRRSLTSVLIQTGTDEKEYFWLNWESKFLHFYAKIIKAISTSATVVWVFLLSNSPLSDLPKLTFLARLFSQMMHCGSSRHRIIKNR